MRTCASGATTVVMSRPSATMPRPSLEPPFASTSINPRWRSRSTALTGRFVATADTAVAISVLRMAAVTSVCPTRTAGLAGSITISSGMVATASATASASASGTPWSRHHHVAARYIAPVSR